MYILVTGGAGYIGSVTVETLLSEGHQVVVFDNLSQGFLEAINPNAYFFKGDLLNISDIQNCLSNNSFDAVIHLASHSKVEESVNKPALYLKDNLTGTLNLLESMSKNNIKRIIFSSSASVYDTTHNSLTEESDIKPSNPYAESKYLIERMLPWFYRTHNISYVCLRYFNVAGASKHYGESHHPETHLIPNLLNIPLKQNNAFHLYGHDYPTPDGTCIRDFIHVLDVARAHSATLKIPLNMNRIYNI